MQSEKYEEKIEALRRHGGQVVEKRRKSPDVRNLMAAGGMNFGGLDMSGNFL